MLFLIGSAETLFSLCLFNDLDLGLFNEDIKVPHSINYTLFGSALALEFSYWLITRAILTRKYFKSYGQDRTLLYCCTIVLAHSLMTLMPCEMLIFFGYEGKQTQEFERGLLNYSWLRRIISSVRVAIQLFAVSGLMNGGFVTLACGF